MNIYEALMNIQNELVAPKGQFNSFGKYHYRSCEDILEALKPLLFKYKVALTILDDVISVGDRVYVRATAKLILIEDGSLIYTTSLAREDDNKKGFDSSQLTGSTSSYARKYALNGLFAIDDTKDSDTTNKHDKEVVEPKKDIPVLQEEKPLEKVIDTISTGQQKRLFAISQGNNDLVKEALKVKELTSTSQIKKSDYTSICKYIEDVVKATTEAGFNDTDEETPF